MITCNKLLPGLFKYCGGKKRVLKELDGFFDTHYTDTFVDLCGGSGIVTANCIAGRRIISDITTELTTIYKALSCDKYAYPLADILQSLECNEETFENAKAYLEEHSRYSLDDYTDEELPTAAAYSWFVHFSAELEMIQKPSPNFPMKSCAGGIRLLTEKYASIWMLLRALRYGIWMFAMLLKGLKTKLKRNVPYISTRRTYRLWTLM